MDNIIMKRWPPYFRRSAIMWGIAKGQVAALEECAENAVIFDRELYILTAIKNLDRWEADLNLETPPMMDDYNRWLELRRANILAKKIGYNVPCTKVLVETTAEYFTDGHVTVEESYYKDYVLMLKFHKIGVPTLLKQLLAAVSEIKPAHMLMRIDLRSRTWGDVFDGTQSWSSAQKYTWRDVKWKEDILNEGL